MFRLFRKYTIEDLKKIKETIKIDRSIHKIALIDDNIFNIVDDLRRHDFDITTFTDIDHLGILKNYDVIISDIKGVGKKLGSKLEGAHLIEEINRLYPNKYLIAYSSSTFNPSYNDYFKLCDVTKRKNIDIQEWVKCLDEAITNINDPIFQWEKTRQVLIKQKLPIDFISNLEKAYSKSLVKRDSKYLQRELKGVKSFGESTLVKVAADSISTFAAAFITNLIK